MKKINWRDHLVNLFVVILGISIAFALENWREIQRSQSLEKEYLMALEEDIKYDLELLDTLHKMDLVKLEMINKLAQYTYTERVNPDSIGLYLAYLQFNLPFTPQSVTFDAINTSGKMEIISNFKIRREIISLYQQYYAGMKQYDDEMSLHIRQFLRPYATENLVYTGPISVKVEFF